MDSILKYLLVIIVLVLAPPSLTYTMTCIDGTPSDCSTQYDPVEADCSTRLMELSPGEDYHKIPLILIHGIHGTEKDGICNPTSDYFANILKSLELKKLTRNYKIYQYYYESDLYVVYEIAESLRNKIDKAIDCYNNSQGCSDEVKMNDVPVVMLAHSMGGLVARSYMQQFRHMTGKYVDKLGTDRVLKLITLATPHHGSPAANEEAALREHYTDLTWDYKNFTWDQVFSVSQLFYNMATNSFSSVCYSYAPNRSDLRWDNLIQPTIDEENYWLRILNSTLDKETASKIIAYWGFIDPNRSDRKMWENLFYLIPELPYAGIFGTKNHKLLLSSAIMDAGLSELFPLNDGMVPSKSGSGEGLSFEKTKEFFDYDHLQMREGKKELDGTTPLFDAIEEDLNLIFNGVPHFPVKPIVLDTVNFDGNGVALLYGLESVDIAYQWDFGDGETGSGPTPSHVYYTTGDKLASLIVTDISTGKTYGPLSIEIHISPYPIDVSYPGGSNSSQRSFSTPLSTNLNPSFLWDFGDNSSPVPGSNFEDKNISDHSYENPGYYEVTLTLTVEGQLPITSKRGIIIGEGTANVPGHNISYETWSSGRTYIVEGRIDVIGTLIIEPGAVIIFTGDSGIFVKGSIQASGATFSCSDDILRWYGIVFSGGNGVIDNCIFENISNLYSSIINVSSGTPSITNSLFRNSSALTGITITGGSSPLISGNTIDGMSYQGISIQDAYPQISNNTLQNCGYGIYVDNDSETDPVIFGNTYSSSNTADFYITGTINSDTLWTNNKIYQTGTLAINKGARLTLAEGTIVEILENFTVFTGGSLNIEPECVIRVSQDGRLDSTGTLVATDATFTWTSDENLWNGITIQYDSASGSRLDNCIIEHAVFALSINDASPLIKNCTINGAGRGIVIKGDSSPVIKGNNITGGYHGIYMYDLPFQSITPEVTNNIISKSTIGIEAKYRAESNPVIHDNIYTDNTDVDLNVSGTIDTVTEWTNAKSIGIISTMVIAEGGSITIPPNTKVAMSQGVDPPLKIEQGGVMTIGAGAEINLAFFPNGTSIDVEGTLIATNVLFTSEEDNNPSAWGGIYFSETAGESRLENCTFENAAGYLLSPISYIRGGVITINGSSPLISGCLLHNCNVSATGIYLLNHSSPLIENTTISDMDRGIYVGSESIPQVIGNTVIRNDIGIEIVYAGGIYRKNIIMNNTSYGMYSNFNFNFDFCPVDANYNYWGDPTGPYNLTDNPEGKGDNIYLQFGYIDGSTIQSIEYNPWATDISETFSLIDVIFGLKLITGERGFPVNLLKTDMNGDNRIGIEDVIGIINSVGTDNSGD